MMPCTVKGAGSTAAIERPVASVAQLTAALEASPTPTSRACGSTPRISPREETVALVLANLGQARVV